MFQFTAKFLRKRTAATAIIPDAPTGDAVKTTTTDHLNSRLMLDRQSRAKNGHQQCVACLRRIAFR